MARIPEIREFGFYKPKNYMDNAEDDGIDYIEHPNSRIKVDPNVAKEAIKSILLKEIGDYVKDSFNLTCENINSMIERLNDIIVNYCSMLKKELMHPLKN